MNVTFSNNSAVNGGGIFNSDHAETMVRNTILWGNTAVESGNEIQNSASGNLASRYNLYRHRLGLSDIIFGGSGFTYSNILTTDPLFSDADAENYRLQPGSTAINAGDPETDNLLFPTNESGAIIDLGGNYRFSEGIVDLGAYEFQGDDQVSILLDIPSLVSPENASSTMHDHLVLAWLPVEHAEAYRMQMAPINRDFTEALFDDTVEQTEVEVSALQAETEYKWRVKALRNPSVESEWSEVWTFATEEVLQSPPLAINDTLYVATGDVVEADLLANDLDPQDEAITITALDTNGTLGVVTIGDEGLWVQYEAPDEFNGTDSFRYTIRNESGETSEAEVTVFVQPGLSADRHTIALYKFEEENTALVRDYSGNDNNATGIGTSAAESPFGTGRYMDGVSDYINMGVTRQALQGATEWTIEFTAAAVDSFTGPPAMINHSCGNGWVLMRRPGNITYGVKTTAQGSCFWQDGGFQSTPAPRMDTRWHHYVLTWKSGEALRVYQDGEMLVDVPTAGIFQITQVFPNTALLGRSDSGTGSFQEGFVDEVRVSNIARTPEEVQRTFLILNRYLNLETNLLPGIVTLIAPADGAVDIPANPTLSWEGSEGAEWYDLQLTEDPDFSNLLIDASDIQQTEYQITDDLKTGTTFFWRVRAGNGSGNSEWSEPQSFTTVLPASMYAEEHPKEFELSQNYPNPFNPSTRIRFALPEPSHVNLTVYSVLGQHIATLVNENLSAGWHEVSFDASVFSSAMLLYRIEAGEHIQVKQMMLIK